MNFNWAAGRGVTCAASVPSLLGRRNRSDGRRGRVVDSFASWIVACDHHQLDPYVCQDNGELGF